MARLSDLIKQGKVPEKKQKDEVKIRDLASLKEDKEEVVKITQEEKLSSEEIIEMDLPTEAKTESKKEEQFEKPDVGSLESISLPSEEDLEAPSSEELEEQKRIEDLYISGYNFIEGVLNKLKRKQKFTIEKGLEIVSEIVNTKKATGILYGKAVQGRKDIPESLALHSVNVCIYALMLGKGVNYSSKQLIELGITAILHDIGMVLIPQEIVEKNGKLTASEIEKVRKHPYYTYKVLQTLGEKYSWIAKVAYQEQEREGGQGYPRGLKGDEIHEYAKIIGVVDVYEALTHHRPQRKGYMPHEAVKLLLGTQKERLSTWQMHHFCTSPTLSTNLSYLTKKDTK